MALNVSYSGSLVSYGRYCYPETNKYWFYQASATCSYSSTLNSDNSYTITVKSISGSLSGRDVGGYSGCNSPWEGQCKYGCCSPTTVYIANNLSGSMTTVGVWNLHLKSGITGSYNLAVNQSFTLAPGASRTITLGKGTSCSSTLTRTVTFSNTNTKPSPTPPSVSAYASCSSSSYTSASFSASISYGYCETGSNSSSYTVKDESGNTIKSGSGSSVSIGTLQANSRYTYNVSASNGCYSRSSSASTVTATGNSLTDLTAKSWDTASVRIVPVMGGWYYSNPTHTIQITEAGKNAWRNVATSNATAPTVVEFSGLVDETAYQVRCVTTNGSACSYTSSTLQFTTPKKGICLANFTSIESETNSRCSQTWTDMCYNYETLLTPADIIVYYRVKDGYDPTWQVADSRTINQDKGSVCFRIEDIFPNQVVYETYIHTHTAEVDWDSDVTEFTSPLCPEVTSDNCESLTYMTEYLCAAVKKIVEGGNMKVFANPYSLKLCQPGDESPTSLTLWSRYLRLAHAYLCILCDFMNLSNAHAGQYLVGEVGWVNILTEIVESQVDADGWRLATGDAIWKYIQEKLKQVWHYQGTVDVMVSTKADLDNYPDATSAIVKDENAIYEKVDGEWVKSETEPENFGVWHIEQDSDVATAESGWYFWEGTWNNLDANVEELEEILLDIEKRSQLLVQNAEGEHKKVAVVDKDFNFADAPADEDIIYFVVESATLPEPIYYTVTFTEEDGTVIRTQRVIAGGIVGLFTPTKAGNIFTGWTKDGAAFDGTMPITGDTTLVANWQLEQVTVEYSIGDADGETPAMVVGEYGMTLDLPNDDNFYYEGKTFGGWEWKGVVWSNTMPVWEDMVLEAVWDSVMLTVAIRIAPDQPDQIMQVEYGTIIEPPKVPEREGWTFVGWKTESGEDFDFSQPITQNTTIVAEWVVSNVTVTFNAQTLPPDAGESVENPPSVTVQRGTVVAEPVVTADNYIVVYWTLNGMRYNFDTPVTENITLDAVWSKVIEVDFDPDGGEPAPETQRVPEGGYATKPEDPVKEGCEFEGWAEEEVIYHTVTVEPNNGEGGYTVQVIDGKKLPTQKQPENDNPDCEWVGWQKDGAAYDFSQPVTEDFTLEGKWNCKVTVTFDPNMEGLSTFTEKVDSGEPVEEPETPIDPSGECEFDYWDKEGE